MGIFNTTRTQLSLWKDDYLKLFKKIIKKNKTNKRRDTNDVKRNEKRTSIYTCRI